MKSSYVTAGITLPRFLRLLRKNQVSLRPKYIGRILFILQASFWSYIFSLVEKKRYQAQIKATPVPEDPIFIIGHWRTGSTFLHQLIAQDPSLAAPSLFQVVMPENFISSERFFHPVMKPMIAEYRPMDHVKVNLEEPQEDEYAIYRQAGFSPLENLVFPKSGKYFLAGMDSYLPPSSDLGKWEEEFILIFKKLQFATGRRIVSKNPFNSLRIPEIHRMFPGARFIHIYRHPYDVVPSTQHLWKIVQEQNCLNHRSLVPKTEEIVEVFDHILLTIRRDLEEIPRDHWCQVRFEDLEQDPLNEMKKLYDELDMDFTEEIRKRMKSFLDSIGKFQKNQFLLSFDEKQYISGRLKDHMNYFHYAS